MLADSRLIADLEDAIHSGVADRRTAMLRRVTDLFIGGADTFSEDQVTLFDDVIGRIATSIEAKARAELAERLAPIANAPPGVIRMLATDEEANVAAPVLSESPQIEDDILVDVVNTKSQQHMLAISSRTSLGTEVTDALVQRGNQEVVRTVANNIGAKFSDSGFGVLVDRSQGDDILSEIVGMRLDLPRPFLAKLVGAASHVVRQRLAARNPQLANDIAAIVSHIVAKTS